jgi:cytochrome c oxidase cbb3-type subunit III
MSKSPHKKPEVGTTGHIWDGIEELNNPLPRWWLWTLYATIVWGIGYVIAYPAWPMLTGATPGVLGYSTRAELAAEIEIAAAANANLMTALASADLTTLASNPDLNGFAINAGAAVFRANCSQCHGAGAAGGKGYPNLLDNDWLWGGAIADIAFTVTHGIRNEQSPETRFSLMPAFGEVLAEEEIDALVQHVLAISGQEHDAATAETGAALFAENCSSCHGEIAEGNRDLGAPKLSDAIWLYGSDPAAIKETITYARNGVMPAWSTEWRVGTGLDQAEINAVAAYVHQLGGGE